MLGCRCNLRGKNRKRAIECIDSNHGRVLEFVNIEMVISGYSARVMREFERHHIGASFLQESTRYVDCNNFSFYIPESIKNNSEANAIYEACMMFVRDSYRDLCNIGISKENAANLLPLGMHTKIVDRRNLRSLIEMSHQRLCNRALLEYRSLMNEIKDALRDYSDEWAYVVDKYLVPKCIYFGKCTERHSCKDR